MQVAYCCGVVESKCSSYFSIPLFTRGLSQLFPYKLDHTLPFSHRVGEDPDSVNPAASQAPPDGMGWMHLGKSSASASVRTRTHRAQCSGSGELSVPDSPNQIDCFVKLLPRNRRRPEGSGFGAHRVLPSSRSALPRRQGLALRERRNKRRVIETKCIFAK